MTRREFICDRSGVTAAIEIRGLAMLDALDHEKADPVIRCAVLMALSTLLQGGEWPTEVLANMAGFMSRMRDQVSTAQLQEL